MRAKCRNEDAGEPESAEAWIVCAGCGVTRERPATRRGETRVPAGWKRLIGRFWCPACKRHRFVRRAVTLPVSGPADATWPELRAALHTAFEETTRCANWLVTQLYARDRQREPHDARLNAMPRVYLYPEARRLFPSLASQTLASLEQQVLARYRAGRLALVWRHATSLPTYRYPTPLPLPARMWTLDRHDQRWCLSVRIGDRRWSLRLRQGPDMRRQLGLLQQIADGEVEAGEATLYEIPAHRGDHRTGSASDRRLMVKVAVWLAHRERADDSDSAASRRDAGVTMEDAHVLIVRTAADAFVVAHLANAARGATAVNPDPANGAGWMLHGDQVRRWIAHAARRRERLQQDLARLDPGTRGRFTDGLAEAERMRGARLHRRLHDWTHQSAAQLIAWARQHRVRTIAWDDTDHSYLPAFPWHRFATTLADKAALAGIRVVKEIATRHPSFTSHTSPAIERSAGHLQAEARARPGTRAGRDRSWKRAQAPEIAG